MTVEELNIKIKERPVEEQRDYLLEQNMLLTGKIAELEAIVRNTKAVDESFALQTIRLTKAKEYIKHLCGMVRELNNPNVQLTNVDYSLAEIEQFIKDSEVEK